jgi:hypothetical protein
MIKLTKKAIERLDAVTSVPYSRKGLGYRAWSGCRLTFHLLLLLLVLLVQCSARGKLMKCNEILKMFSIMYFLLHFSSSGKSSNIRMGPVTLHSMEMTPMSQVMNFGSFGRNPQVRRM